MKVASKGLHTVAPPEKKGSLYLLIHHSVSATHVSLCAIQPSSLCPNPDFPLAQESRKIDDAGSRINGSPLDPYYGRVVTNQSKATVNFRKTTSDLQPTDEMHCKKIPALLGVFHCCDQAEKQL